ncbi:MAG TPA: ABC transporter substrate-binding protein [Geminicoccaceae bacterium]|nr:ABC transporter substrate-binding protein [Geminicoccaceae bacterium]
MQLRQNRRHFLASASLAAAAGAFGARTALADDGPLETTTIRLAKTTTICFAPIYVLEAFLRAEGFSDIQYVTAAGGFTVAERVGRGDIDIGTSFAGTVVYHLDAGFPITALGGMHVGCYELFAREPIRSIGDLKGRRVGIQTLASSAHLYLSIMATEIGLDPQEDILWVTSPEGDAMERFIAGETEAFLGFPPEPQELRSRGVNRVILNTILDRPWSQYFCCMMYGNRAWVRDHPVATKRFLRSVYKAADFCTADAASAARQLVDGGFAERYDYALQTIEEITYDRWHEFDSEDTVRFYALRLHEAGMIQSSPNALIAEGTDWRFVSELKRELKA